MIFNLIVAFNVVLLFANANAIPIQVYPAAVDDEGVEILVVNPSDVPKTQSIRDRQRDDREENEEWKLVQDYSEQSMGKRSIALGRSGFRPGKRSSTIDSDDIANLIMKRSMAIGRLGLRPGKRSISFGRLNFRPGKRSMAYGRQGFRPGKRSLEIAEFPYQSPTPEIYVY